MQTVSQEWIDNMNSITRKQGYVIIEMETTGGDTVTISTLDGATALKSITHNRTYDPVAFSIPTNNITIELYNYNGAYDEFYKSYSSETLKVVVRYGFRLTEDEEIEGGTFYISDVAQDDRILTITAESTLEMANGGDSDITLVDEEYLLYTSSSSTGTQAGATLDGLASLTDITYSDALDRVNAEWGDIVNYEGNEFGSKTLNYGLDSATISRIIQQTASCVGARCVINRNDAVELATTTNAAPQYIIRALNMRSRPSYSRTKAVRCVDVDTTTDGSGESKTVEFTRTTTYSVAGSDLTWVTDTDAKTTTFTCVVDNLTKYEVTNVSGSISTNLEEPAISILSVSRRDEDETVIVKLYDWVTGYAGITYAGYIDIELTSRRTDLDYRINVNTNGDICDVSNSFDPPDTDRIISYFANRDVYDLDLRGDPALDVGDYVYVEIGGEIHTALILESELVFDGSFKDTMQVRIIDTAFESVSSGNTHGYLAGITHEALSQYTHEQIAEGAVTLWQA